MNTIIKNMVPDGEKWVQNGPLWTCVFGGVIVRWYQETTARGYIGTHLSVQKGPYLVQYKFDLCLGERIDSRQVVAAYEKMLDHVTEMDNYDLSRHGEEE
jgi:hypothetical protein